MVIVTVIYVALVYLVFVKFQWLPWNRLTRLIALSIGIVILSGFLVGLENLTPSSTQAMITGRVVDIAPQVPSEVVPSPVSVGIPRCARKQPTVRR